jgi:hypothetical protein
VQEERVRAELGRAGPAGVSGYEIVVHDDLTPPGVTNRLTATDACCPTGKKVVGGGYVPLINSDNLGTVEGWRSDALTALYSTPLADGSGWRVGFEATDDIVGVRVRAICVTTG